MGSWLPRQIGGVLWFGNDDANMVAYTPIYLAIRFSRNVIIHQEPMIDIQIKMHIGYAIGLVI